MTKLDKRLKYQHEDEKPVTISMRLPKELHTRLEQYAAQHRQSISELLRDGLEWRLSDGDPRGLGAASTTDDEAYYMSNTAQALADIRQALARQEAHLQAVREALAPGGPHRHEQRQTVPLVTEPSAGQTPTLPAYDHAKHHLGKLCPRQHDWNQSGQSLRNADNQCLECKAQEKREKRAQQRQAAAQQEVSA